MPVLEKTQELKRFKLLRGIHRTLDQNPDSETKGEKKTYKPGAVIHSELDLVTKFGRDRFQNLDEDSGSGGELMALRRRIRELEAQLRGGGAADAAETAEIEPSGKDLLPDNVDSMGVEELRGLANSLGIQLGKATKKEDILKVLKSSADEMVKTSR